MPGFETTERRRPRTDILSSGQLRADGRGLREKTTSPSHSLQQQLIANSDLMSTPQDIYSFRGTLSGLTTTTSSKNIKAIRSTPNPQDLSPIVYATSAPRSVNEYLSPAVTSLDKSKASYIINSSGVLAITRLTSSPAPTSTDAEPSTTV